MSMPTKRPDAAAVKAAILEKYPVKVAKKRSKSMVVKPLMRCALSSSSLNWCVACSLSFHGDGAHCT